MPSDDALPSSTRQANVKREPKPAKWIPEWEEKKEASSSSDSANDVVDVSDSVEVRA